MSSLGVQTCLLCGKMFKYKGNPLCPVCIHKSDQDYVVARDYLYENPGAGMMEIVQETELDEKTVLHLVRSGRLTFADGVDTGIYCQTCGRPISKGQFCDKCANQISQTLQSAVPRPQEKNSSLPGTKMRGIRMYTSDLRKGDR